MSKVTQDKKRKKLMEQGLNPLRNEFTENHLQEVTAMFGLEIATWILNQLDNSLEGQDYEFMDTFRVYEEGNAEQREKFQDIASNGCCGNFEETYTHPSGRSFVVGFNYGH